MGLGTQDSLELARDFRARHDMETVRLFWEDGFESWAHFGVTGQPAAVLLDAEDGTVLGRWVGLLDEAALADILDRATA